jgi:hypothetical protein
VKLTPEVNVINTLALFDAIVPTSTEFCEKLAISELHPTQPEHRAKSFPP